MFMLTDPPATQSAPCPFHSRPTYNLSDSDSPPFSTSDAPNTTTVTTHSPRSSSFKSFTSSPLNLTSPAFQSNTNISLVHYQPIVSAIDNSSQTTNMGLYAVERHSAGPETT
ncbi:hypothetical protein K443DRAFT_4704 [Laccaria amethystina LaAM-08-1]|uniref:Uncharacterized protein n=1 Tax=Laccaria amethystina LaAM-08-1 TaxID=1095629 RepID=A0A0C9Y2U1_9AGAR|nr:hypothetical protein K443DRAFT_4704 [Laccaria amethystina LaAM-08-1]